MPSGSVPNAPKGKISTVDSACLLVIAAGCATAVYGFNDLSIHNPDPPRWYSIYLFGIGLFTALGGLLGLVFPGVRQLFSGRRGI